MGGYGIRAILALPWQTPARQLRLLMALDTFAVCPAADCKTCAELGTWGWRHAGQVLLCEVANMSRVTLRLARDELVALAVVEYEAGRGRGNFSSYREHLPEPKRGNTVLTQTDALKGVTPAPEKGKHPPAKRGNPDRAEQAQRDPWSKDSGLKSFGQSSRPVLCEDGRDFDDRLIKMIIEEIRKATGRTIGPYWAELTYRNLVGDRPYISNPMVYIRSAIRAEPNPRTRFLSLYDDADQR